MLNKIKIANLVELNFITKSTTSTLLKRFTSVFEKFFFWYKK